MPASGGPKAKKGPKQKRCLLRVAFNVENPSQYGWIVLDCRLSGRAAIYLNGELILRPAQSGQSHLKTVLKPGTCELLKRGRNVIAVELSGDRSFVFDCGLLAGPSANR